MGKRKYVIGASLALAGGLALLVNNSSYTSPNNPQIINRPESRVERVSSKYEKSGKGTEQNYLESKNDVHKENIDYSRVISDPSAVYGVLIDAFRDNLDGLDHYGGAGHFKGRFADLRDLRADYVLKELESLDERRKQELIEKYGDVINSLKGSSSTLEEIASAKGYMLGNETADKLWPEIELPWGKSKLGKVFLDVLDNDYLNPNQLEGLLVATNIYCKSVGRGEEFLSLEEKIRISQRSYGQYEALQKKVDSGQNLSDEEQGKLNSWVRDLGKIEEDLERITSESSNKSKSEVNKLISSNLRSINPLYGLAFEVVGLEK